MSSGVRYGTRTRNRAASLARKGVSVPQISRKLGATQRTVRTWLRESGIDPPLAKRRKHDRDLILKALETSSRTSVQAKFKCSAKFLSDLVNEKIVP